jgi:hypothetical protein
MPEWGEVVAYLKQRHMLAAEHPSWVGLVWDVGAPGRAVLQRTKLEATRVNDEPWVLILAEVCREESCDARVALLRAAQIGFGAYAIDHGHLVVRHAARLETLALADIERALVACAQEAARMRAEVAAPYSAELYGAFSD